MLEYELSSHPLTITTHIILSFVQVYMYVPATEKHLMIDDKHLKY